MIIAGEYSFNGGKEFIIKKYEQLLNEIRDIILAVDAEQNKTKAYHLSQTSHTTLLKLNKNTPHSIGRSPLILPSA